MNDVLTNCKISQLVIYPVKSLGGISLPTMTFDELGPVGDRRYMLVDATGKFISQRQYAAMAQVSISLCDEQDITQGYALKIPSTSLRSHLLHLPFKGETGVSQRLLSSVWSDTVNAYKQTAPDFLRIIAALETLLGVSGLSLVYIPNSLVRSVDERFSKAGHQVGFADGFPSLVCSETSLDALNECLGTPISMQRFRPNVVIQSLDKPGQALSAFQEFQATTLTHKHIDFSLDKPCSRCVIPTINPSDLQKEPAVWKALQGIASGEVFGLDARFKPRDVFFGQNATHVIKGCDSAGKISVGDAVKLS